MSTADTFRLYLPIVEQLPDDVYALLDGTANYANLAIIPADTAGHERAVEAVTAATSDSTGHTYGESKVRHYRGNELTVCIHPPREVDA